MEKLRISPRREYQREYRKKNKQRRRLLYKQNIERHRQQDKAHYRKTRERHRELRISLKYGISVVEYQRLFVKYGNKCGICRKPESANNKVLSVDHDHKSGKVRGLLCNRCNKSLGFLQDNPELAFKIVKYLKNAPTT